MTSISESESKEKKNKLMAMINGRPASSALLKCLKECGNGSERMLPRHLESVEKALVDGIMATEPDSVWLEAIAYFRLKSVDYTTTNRSTGQATAKSTGWFETRVNGISGFSKKALSYLIIMTRDVPFLCDEVLAGIVWSSSGSRLDDVNGVLQNYRETYTKMLLNELAGAGLPEPKRREEEKKVDEKVEGFVHATVLRCVLVAARQSTTEFLIRNADVVKAALNVAPAAFPAAMGEALALNEYGEENKRVRRLDSSITRKAKMPFMVKVIEFGMPIPDNFLSVGEAGIVDRHFKSLLEKAKNTGGPVPARPLRDHLKVMNHENRSVAYFATAQTASLTTTATVATQPTSSPMINDSSTLAELKRMKAFLNNLSI